VRFGFPGTTVPAGHDPDAGGVPGREGAEGVDEPPHPETSRLSAVAQAYRRVRRSLSDPKPAQEGACLINIF